MNQTNLCGFSSFSFLFVIWFWFALHLLWSWVLFVCFLMWWNQSRWLSLSFNRLIFSFLILIILVTWNFVVRCFWLDSGLFLLERIHCCAFFVQNNTCFFIEILKVILSYNTFLSSFILNLEWLQKWKQILLVLIELCKVLALFFNCFLILFLCSLWLNFTFVLCDFLFH
jgi:hypothetical protein